MAADGTGDKLDGGSQAAPTFPEVELLCTKLFEETVAVKDHYDHNEALKWNTKLVESITEGLVAMSRPFKYCVTCIVMEAGAKFGLNVSSTCFWDKQSDMSYSVRCESKNVIAIFAPSERLDSNQIASLVKRKIEKQLKIARNQTNDSTDESKRVEINDEIENETGKKVY